MTTPVSYISLTYNDAEAAAQTRQFVCAYMDDISLYGITTPATLELAVNGVSLLVIGPRSYQTWNLTLKFTGNEDGTTWGTWAQFQQCYSNRRVTMVDWSSNEWDVVFLDNTLTPMQLEPFDQRKLVNVTLQTFET